MSSMSIAKYRRRKRRRKRAGIAKKLTEREQEAHDYLMNHSHQYKKYNGLMMRLLKEDKNYMRSRKFKKLDNKSKSYLRQIMRKVVKKTRKSKKKDKKLNYKQATKLKKSLSSGFKDTHIRELNTSVAS